MITRSAHIWERDERDGWRLIVPLQGEQKHNANLLNPTARIIYDQLTKMSCLLTEVTKRLCKEYPGESGVEIDKDVKQMALRLQDLGVYKMSTKELHIMRTRGDLSPGLHVMREVEITDVANQLANCFSSNASSPNIMYSLLKPTSGTLKPFMIRHLHIRSEQTFFVYTDNEGKVAGVVSLYQPNKVLCAKHIGVFVVFCGKQTIRIQLGIKILESLEQIASQLFCAHKLRFILQNGSTVSPDSVPNIDIICNWDELSHIITYCGYRNEVELTNEFGPGISATYYSKVF